MKDNDLIYIYLESLRKTGGFFKVTKMEMRVGELLLMGNTAIEISEMTGRSIKTISSQKKSLFKKLGVKNEIGYMIFLFKMHIIL